MTSSLYLRSSELSASCPGPHPQSAPRKAFPRAVGIYSPLLMQITQPGGWSDSSASQSEDRTGEGYPLFF